ncbi:MAG: hypothetical protein EOP35_16410 [Rubrivivax sp.]|nr:MAG: hypothetical protein EOP35_16410 [Rubrivivax sp.]
MDTWKWMAAVGLGLTLLACGGGGGSDAGGGPKPGGESPPISLAVPGRFITKLGTGDSAWFAMAEKSQDFVRNVAPDRQLLAALDGAATPGIAYQPPAGWSLIDFAVHPSREVSLVLASPTQLRLVRLSRSGAVLRDQPFLDPPAATDAIIDGPFPSMDSASLVPTAVTHDAAQLAALGEDVVLAFRSGRFAVVLHRLGYSAANGFVSRWRSLAEPGVMIGASLPLSGSFDPFKGVDNMWRVFLAADAQGRIAVALALSATELAAGHARHFGKPLDTSAVEGFMLSRFSADGQRSYSVLHRTEGRSEVQGLRWLDDRIAVVGRVRTVRSTDGWDAYVALVADGTRALTHELVNVDQGEVLFDIARLPNGQLLACGAAGYTQNPTGVSVSETATPLLMVLDAAGKPVRRVALTAGPRHNQLRSLAAWQGGWLMAGMENGPGTHSADGDAALLTADGYVRKRRDVGL